MICGDQIRLIPDLQGNNDHKVLWEDPLDVSSSKNGWISTGRFRCTDVGIVLEQKHILEGPLHVQTTWVKVLCPGGLGWMKRCDAELVR